MKLPCSGSQILTAVGLLALAVLFGGGGSGAGAANLVVQLASLAALAYHRTASVHFFRNAPRLFAVLIVSTILLPLLQCLPLPAAIWHHLPGRGLVVETLTLVDRQDSWMPFSLNVRRTFIAFLALLPPFTILILTWRADDGDRRLLLTALVVCGVMEIIVGTQQLAFGNREFMLYAETIGSQDLQGTFANRNTGGLFADIVLCALIGLLWQRRLGPARLGVAVVVGALLGLGLFLTRSRSSMALVIIPVLMLLMLLWSSRRTLIGKRSRMIAFLGVLSVLVISAGLLADNSRIQHSLSRFDTLKDARPVIWQDARSSVARFWPLGSGIGTFDEVFQLDESLENLSPGRAARAHNEYLETTLESGLLGPVFVASWIAIVALAAWRAIRKATDPGPTFTATAVFLLLAFQSILDYPLRSQTMLCVAGLMLGILITQTSISSNGGARHR